MRFLCRFLLNTILHFTCFQLLINNMEILVFHEINILNNFLLQNNKFHRIFDEFCAYPGNLAYFLSNRFSLTEAVLVIYELFDCNSFESVIMFDGFLAVFNC